MGVLEVYAKALVGIAWPFVVFMVIRAFAEPITELINRIRTADISKDGWRFGFDDFQRVAENKATQEEKNQVRLQSVVESGENATGSYTLYSNRTIVARVKVELKAMTTSRQILLPICIVNEITSVQVVGNANVRVTSLNSAGVGIDFDATNEDRTVQLIVTGL